MHIIALLSACSPTETPAVTPPATPIEATAPVADPPAAPVGATPNLTLTGGGFTVTAQVPEAWGTPVVGVPQAFHDDWTGSERLALAHWPNDTMLGLDRWDTAFTDDPGEEGDIRLVVADKQAQVALAQRLWDSKSIDGLLVRNADGYDEFAGHGLFWGGIDSIILVHSAKYVEVGELRGIELIGTPGQDYGFEPRVFVYLVNPADRVVLTLDHDVSKSKELAGIGQDEAGIAKGEAVVDPIFANHTGDLGARLDAIDALIASVRVVR